LPAEEEPRLSSDYVGLTINRHAVDIVPLDAAACMGAAREKARLDEEISFELKGNFS